MYSCLRPAKQSIITAVNLCTKAVGSHSLLSDELHYSALFEAAPQVVAFLSSAVLCWPHISSIREFYFRPSFDSPIFYFVETAGHADLHTQTHCVTSQPAFAAVIALMKLKITLFSYLPSIFWWFLIFVRIFIMYNRVL